MGFKFSILGLIGFFSNLRTVRLVTGLGSFYDTFTSELRFLLLSSYYATYMNFTEATIIITFIRLTLYVLVISNF